MKYLLFLLFTCASFAQESYQFKGKHFLASYLECDPEAIENVKGMLRAMDDAVRASGATILGQSSYVFQPNGVTAVYLLSESHASLHTYPEHRACFVDIFTCGDHCSSLRFHEALQAYLKPQTTSARFFIRGEEIEEAPIP